MTRAYRVGKVLVVANLVATATRFVGLRWVFRKHLDGGGAGRAAEGEVA